MARAEVLALHGSPGSGKTTLSRVMASQLRAADVPHAVVDLDDLSMVYPEQPRPFARENLRAMWPNFAGIPGLRLIVPTVLADEQEVRDLQAVVPGCRLIVCELTRNLSSRVRHVGFRRSVRPPVGVR